MIGTDDVQRPLIAALAGLAPDIAEFNYQSTDYTFPCLRAHVISLTPGPRNGNCVRVICNFEVVAYSESESSAGVAALAKTVEVAVSNKPLIIGSVQSTPVRIMSVPGPIPMPTQRGWAAHVIMSCDVSSAP